MPTKEDSTSRHRMVVEEIETVSDSPKKSEEIKIEEPTPDILNEGANVSSQDIIEENDHPKIEAPVAKENKTASPVLWIIIPGIFILGAILGGIVFYQKGVNSTKNNSTTPTAVATSTPTPTATASPSASVDISKYDIAVFNGSGIAGEAGKAKSLLETAGFTVSSTGNAATYDYTKTIIKAKASMEASIVERVKKALSNTYVVGDNQTLSSSATTDIQVVVGSSKTN